MKVVWDISVEMYRKKNIYVSLDFVDFSKKLEYVN